MLFKKNNIDVIIKEIKSILVNNSIVSKIIKSHDNRLDLIEEKLKILDKSGNNKPKDQ